MSEHPTTVPEIPVTEPAPAWSGRTDGDGPEHLRWHQLVVPWGTDGGREAQPGGVVVLGFASDEGVERNKGRRGAAEGPAALRKALAPLSVLAPDAGLRLYDAGTVVTRGTDLEGGQAALGRAVAATIDAGHLPVVLGGGHEIAYGTWRGVAGSDTRGTGEDARRVGILNLDAHFDLRPDPVPSSGTPFRQILEEEAAAGTELHYAVVGISEASNTQVLFDTAEEYGVDFLLDEDSTPANLPAVRDFVDGFLDRVDLVYLTIDLDVLPASVAPGVSAPAAHGVPLETIRSVCDRVAESGKLVAVDVAELNPAYDVDGRTARTAARLLHGIVRRRARTDHAAA